MYQFFCFILFRLPSVDYKIDDDAIYNLRNKTADILGKVGLNNSDVGLHLDVNNATDKIQRWDGTFFGAYGDEPGMKLAYLLDKGIKITIPYKEKYYTKYADIPMLKKVIKEFNITGSLTTEEERAAEPKLRKMLNEYQANKYSQEIADKMTPLDEELSFSELDSIFYSASQLKRTNETKTLDTSKLRNKVNAKLKTKKANAEYKAWVDELSKDVVAKKGIRNERDMFSPSGNRRNFEALHYDYNLANIIKAMKSQPKQGGGGFLGGAGAVKGATLKSFNSIEEMKNNPQRFADYEEYSKAYDEFKDKVAEASKELHDNIFTGTEIIAEVLQRNRTADEIYRYLNKEYSFLNPTRTVANHIAELVKMANELPLDYYESKLYRAFPMEEALAYIVPNNIDKELKQQMIDRGLNVKTYKTGDSEDRLKKANSIKTAKFSYNTNNFGRKLTEGQIDYFKNSKVRDDQGRLLVVYHMSPNSFTEFDKSKAKSSGMYGSGFYFATSPQYGYGGARYEGYLNLENPLMTDTKNITKEQLKNFVEYIANDDDYGIENYGYGATVDSVTNDLWQKKSDFTMLMDLNSTAIGDAIQMLRMFNEVNGTNYDGIIAPTEIVSMESEQFKDIDNFNPTKSKDIRFSFNTLSNGQRYIDVDVDQDMFENLDFYQARDLAIEILEKRFKGEGKLPYGINLRNRGIKKYYGAYTTENNPILGIDKMRVSPEIDKLLQVTYDGWHEPYVLKNGETKIPTYAEYGYSYHKALFKVGGRFYEGVIKLAVGKHETQFYDLQNLEDVTKEKSIYDKNTPHLNNNSSNGTYQNASKGTLSEKDSNVKNYSKNPGYHAGNLGTARFSQEITNPDLKALQKENRELEKRLEKTAEQVARWKSELKVDHTLRVQKSDINRITDKLLQEYSAGTDKKALKQKLTDLANYVLNNNSDENYVDTVKNMAIDIASDIINDAKVLDEGGYSDVYNDLKRMLTTGNGMKLSSRDIADIPDFKDFKKQDFGKLKITESGRDVDSTYEELMEMYPELFSEDVTHPADRLMEMVDVVNKIAPRMENPFDMYLIEMAEITETLANEIVDMAINGEMKATLPNFATRQENKLNEQKAKTEKAKEQVKEMRDKKNAEIEEVKSQARQKMEKLRQKRSDDIRKLKEGFADKQYRDREKRNAQELRKKIEKKVKDLNQKLLNPTDKKHIPQDFRGVVAKLLESINMTSPKDNDPDTIRLASLRTEAFRDLQKAYEKVMKEGEYVIDDDMLGTDGILEQIIEWGNEPIMEMSAYKLGIIYNTIRSLEHSISTYNRLLSEENGRTIHMYSEGLMNDNESVKAKTEWNGRPGGVVNRMSLGMLTPQAFFHKLQM